jgi:hypothetical protein
MSKHKEFLARTLRHRLRLAESMRATQISIVVRRAMPPARPDRVHVLQGLYGRATRALADDKYIVQFDVRSVQSWARECDRLRLN